MFWLAAGREGLDDDHAAAAAAALFVSAVTLLSATSSWIMAHPRLFRPHRGTQRYFCRATASTARARLSREKDMRRHPDGVAATALLLTALAAAPKLRHRSGRS